MFDCLNCNTSNANKKNTYNRYCNNKCQHEHQQVPFDALKTDSSRKLRILKTRAYVCEICSISEWVGQPIPLELDHIDGNSENNALENLRIICPNCHSQTSTYRGKNRGRGRKKRK